MASSKPTLNPLTDTPVNKTQITKPFMLAYIKSEKATAEDNFCGSRLFFYRMSQTLRSRMVPGSPSRIRTVFSPPFMSK